jgi:hypothetical protein
MKKLLVLLALLVPSFTIAEVNTHRRGYSVHCGETDEIMNHLKDKFDEVIIAMGVTNDSVNSITTIWTNAKTGSFTVLQTNKEISCVISTGNYLEINLEEMTKGESI